MNKYVLWPVEFGRLYEYGTRTEIMKYLKIVLMSAVCLNTFLYARTDADSTYYRRLYFLCKVWGYVKYFHTDVAKGRRHWDDIFMETLAEVKAAQNNQAFNEALLYMIQRAGNMTKPSSFLPLIPDSLSYNLDLRWIQDPIFSYEVKAELDTIRQYFRPRSNYYVESDYEGGSPSFDSDLKYSQQGIDSDLEEPYRLLALFRYWNIINYFFPFKNIIDQDWDTTLVEFIPQMVTADDNVSYHLAFMKLAKRINDTHAFVQSAVVDASFYGDYFLPLVVKYIDDKTVVSHVLTDEESIRPGDIILQMDGMTISAWRDSLRAYINGSNDSAIEWIINRLIVRGSMKDVSLTVEDDQGSREVTLGRTVHRDDYYAMLENDGPIWEILDTETGKLGYVDMGRLLYNHIDTMFNDLWDCDGIIFDVRNYPNKTIWSMVRYLFDEPVHTAETIAPDVEYPGTVYWTSSYDGRGDFSRTYDGRIFILFDETTLCHAEYTVMVLEQYPGAVKIGSQTAGAVGNVSIVTLPGGIETYFTGLGVFYPDYTPTQRVGIVPDIQVFPTIQGIRQGCDEVLDAAIACFLETRIAGGHASAQTRPDPIIELCQNVPNPFNALTYIHFRVEEQSRITLHVYNAIGQRIRTLLDEDRFPGEYRILWDGRNDAGHDVGSGIYLVRLQNQHGAQTKKLLYIR
jgi:carboxyl-terminal processing protease